MRRRAKRAMLTGLLVAHVALAHTGCLKRPKPAWPTVPVVAQADEDVFFRFRPKAKPVSNARGLAKARTSSNSPASQGSLRPTHVAASESFLGQEAQAPERSKSSPPVLPSNWFNAQLTAASQLPAESPVPMQTQAPIELLPAIGVPNLEVEPGERPTLQIEPDAVELLPGPTGDEKGDEFDRQDVVGPAQTWMPLSTDNASEAENRKEASPAPSSLNEELEDDMDRLRRIAEEQLDAKFGGTTIEPTPSPIQTPSLIQTPDLGSRTPAGTPHSETPFLHLEKSNESMEVDIAKPAASVTKVLDATDQSPDFRDLTEDEMLSIALSNAPTLRPLGIRILSSPGATPTIYDAAIEATDPFFGPAAALAEFDSQLSASLTSNKNDRVFNNTTLGGDVQELVQDTIDTRLGWQKRAWNGAVFDIQSIQLYDDNNRQGNRFPNYWESLLEAGVRQPLLRGAGRQFNAIAGPNAQPGFNFSNGIVIARLNTQISDADFQISLRTYVQELYTAYWALRREYESLQSLVEAKRLAFETWQTILAKRNANIKGGEAHVEAQARARYYQLRREVATALDGQEGTSGYYVSERALRQLIGLPVADGRVLRPVDPPADVRYVYDFERLASQAMTGRTELQRQSLNLQKQQYRLVAAKNFLLPQLDLVGRYRLRGFGEDLTGSGARFASASDDFASLDHQEWQFGLEMGVTAGRRQAKAAVNNAKLELTRERAILEEQQRAVRYEVGNAFAEVASSFEALEASKELLNAAQDRLAASTSLYEADKIQLEFLLDAQEEMVQARRRLAEDQSRYSLALILVNAATGTLLEDLGIRTATHCNGVQAVDY